MPVAAVIGATSAAGIAAQTIGAGKALKAQQGMFNTAQQGLQPYIQAGKDSLGPLQDLITPGRANMTSTLEQTPGFNFALTQGLKGVTNQMTSRGLGGNAIRAGADFATGTALEKSYMPIVQALQGLVTTGANAGGNVAQAATTAGQGLAQTQATLGTAQAGGLTNPYLQASLINGLGKTGMYGGNQPNIDQILTSGR